jgi:hypothetical protein
MFNLNTKVELFEVIPVDIFSMTVGQEKLVITVGVDSKDGRL